MSVCAWHGGCDNCVLINMLNYYDISFNFNHDTLDDTKITYRVDQMKKKYILNWSCNQID